MSARPLQRSPRQSGSSFVWIIGICCLLIIAGVRYVFFTDKDATTTPSSDSATTGASTYYIGEKIIAGGQMNPVSTFTTYTHDFVTEEGELFGLKSIEIDLYQYSGSVDIKGEVTDFKEELPIITVTEIVGSKQGTGVAGSVIDGNPDYYFFKDVGLGFDLSISDGYTVEEQAEEILVIDMGGNQPQTVLTISPFVCMPGDSLKDCAALQSKFAEMNNETYVSAQDITFYNLTETKTWLAFNKGYGYYVTPTDENMFTTFIDFMSYMSQERIQEAATSQITSLCKDINQTMTQVTSTQFDYQSEGIVVVSMGGLDSEDNVVSCDVAVRLGNALKVALVEFTPTDGLEDADEAVPQAVVTGSVAPTVPVATGATVQEEAGEEEDTASDVLADTPGITPPSPATTKPADLAAWMRHDSVRGYTMYFSNKSISFAGDIIETMDLGIIGLKCIYQLNLIAWRNADLVDTAPDVIVYECTGTPSASDLAAKNLQQVGTTSTNVFIAKYLTSNLGNFQIYVEEPTPTEE